MESGIHARQQGSVIHTIVIAQQFRMFFVPAQSFSTPKHHTEPICSFHTPMLATTLHERFAIIVSYASDYGRELVQKVLHAAQR